jgi:hypothetical protein
MGQHRLDFVPFMFWLNEPPLMVNAADRYVGSRYSNRNSSIPAARPSMGGGWTPSRY